MKLNGNTPISWKALAIVLATLLYSLVIWIAAATLVEVKAVRTDMGEVQRKNDVQDQRLQTLEAWMWRRSKTASAGASR